MGPTAASAWMASGGDVNQLPKETQDYIKRAAAFLNAGQSEAPAVNADGETNMLSFNNPPGTAKRNEPGFAEFVSGRQAANANANEFKQFAADIRHHQNTTKKPSVFGQPITEEEALFAYQQAAADRKSVV